MNKPSRAVSEILQTTWRHTCTPGNGLRGTAPQSAMQAVLQEALEEDRRQGVLAALMFRSEPQHPLAVLHREVARRCRKRAYCRRLCFTDSLCLQNLGLQATCVQTVHSKLVVVEPGRWGQIIKDGTRTSGADGPNGHATPHTPR